MSTTSTNRSFWQDKIGVPAVIRESPILTTVKDGELLVKAHAWAMNPVDAYIQHNALPIFTYPMIIGCDVSGVVQLVGSGPASQKFKVGDRVLCLAHAAFQDYVVLDHAMAAKIPDTLSFAEAAVFPVTLATARQALFSKKYLALPFPDPDPDPSNRASPDPSVKGKSILIWGAASAVGSNAIQMARAVGLRVVTTCSRRNFEHARALGADAVFDYNDAGVVDEVVAELRRDGSEVCAGIFQAAGPHGAVEPCVQVAARLTQAPKPVVACANLVPAGLGKAEGVEARMVYGGADGEPVYLDTTSVLFEGFLPRALADRSYQVAPTPEVVGTRGLGGVQEALDIVVKGVSAKKIVVLVE
ncbi:GroES-like protein [Hypoxylon sp. NC1633]|nr:GroES-like protein [Hypoxylon sp. NC1633]